MKNKERRQLGRLKRTSEDHIKR